MKGGSWPRRHEQRGGSVEAHSRPSKRAPQVAVIGSSRTEPGSELGQLAEEVGRLPGEAGATVVCGGGPRVMEAVARGAPGVIVAATPEEAVAAALTPPA